MRVSSLCISVKAFSHSLGRDTKRGFLFLDSCLIISSNATRNEEMPDPCKVNTTRVIKERRK